MKSSHSPVVKDLVLVGGGHSHVTVLKRFGMNPLSGVRLTLICRDVHTPYSGMLPGFVAGHYTFDEAHIDLGPLARFAQARLYHDEVVGVDLDKRLLYCRRRPAVPYDLVSVNIGSTPSMSDVRGSTDSVIPVKPINQFVARWERLRRSVRESERPMSIAVDGAGAGGVELTLAVQFALCRARGASERQFPEPQFHLFSGSGEVLPTHNEKARATFRRVLQERGVRVHSGQKVVETGGGVVQLEDGSRINADEVLWVTQAGAASWLREAGLDVDNRGFVRVADTLQSTSHPEVFAAGDIATMVRHPREKAGVFAVRQGKPLEVNLRRALQGRSLQPFTPQKKFLSLISTGNQFAVASRGGWSLSGGVIWKWKDWIDRRFMDKYNVLPEMNTELLVDVPGGVASEEARRELSTAVMRCG
ncbi:MAG: FAD-dependent oxidoreductase, partial [Planctomycetes bacterium]|nr:FAD-dependent oxidoreductase [Planctomycetota bacterium]